MSISIGDALNTLSVLECLEKNWNSYGAEPINKHIINSATNITGFLSDLGKLLHEDTLPNVIVPMTQGRVQFEWFSDKHDRCLEIEFPNPDNIYYLQYINNDTIEGWSSEENTFPVSNKKKICELILWFLE